MDTVFIAIDGSDGYGAHIQTKIKLDKLVTTRIIAYAEVFNGQRANG